MTTLREATELELLEELMRRRKAGSEFTYDRFCDVCDHFVPFEGKGDVPKTYNPCSKGHKMEFHAPEDYSDCWGFYRIDCKDRKAED